MKTFLNTLFVLFTLTAVSQTWSVELRPTLHFPTKEVLEQPLRIGNGLEFTAIYTIGKRTDIYGGLIWNRFDTDENPQEVDIEFIQKGFLLGGMVYFNITETQKNPFYARAGLTLMTVKSNSKDEDFRIKTDPSIGTQIGIGMKIISLGKWYILPEIQFRNSSYQYQVDGANRFLSFGTVSFTGAIRRSF